MRILRLKADGNAGAILLNASSLKVNMNASDEYCRVIDGHGFDDKGDVVAFRVVLTRNEIAALNRTLDLSRLPS